MTKPSSLWVGFVVAGGIACFSLLARSAAKADSPSAPAAAGCNDRDGDGYSLGCAAGPRLGYPTAIQEQNSVPGITNRVLGRLVRAVFIAFKDAARFLPARKIERLGNPVRQKMVAALEGAVTAPSAETKLRILVVGGSQGARAVSDLITAAVATLAGEGVDFSVVHQTGSADLERIEERYRELGLA